MSFHPSLAPVIFVASQWRQEGIWFCFSWPVVSVVQVTSTPREVALWRRSETNLSRLCFSCWRAEEVIRADGYWTGPNVWSLLCSPSQLDWREYRGGPCEIVSFFVGCWAQRSGWGSCCRHCPMLPCCQKIDLEDFLLAEGSWGSYYIPANLYTRCMWGYVIGSKAATPMSATCPAPICK